jgi:predicted HicB family RNase H-like nuclease
MSTLSFENYVGSVETSVEDDVLHGRIELVNDVVTYQAETLRELKKEFEKAVIDYLATCKELGKEPEKTYTGKTNIRMSPSLHKEVARRAIKNGRSMNAEIEMALESWVAAKHGRRTDDMLNIIKAETFSITGVTTKPAVMHTRPSYLSVVRRPELQEA